MNHGKVIITIIIVTSYIHLATPLEVKACNCSQPEVVGTMNTSELVLCEHRRKLTPAKPVAYRLFTNQEESHHFVGYMCSRIRKELIIQGNFWIGAYTKDRVNYEEFVSQEECWYMKQTKKCAGQDMIKMEGSSTAWVYSAVPEGAGWWNANVTYSETNCMLEQITLRKECEACPIVTPFGEIANSSEGSTVLNHMTIVWDESKTRKENCTMRTVLEEGYGLLHENEGRIALRLEDRNNQLDFFLTKMERLPCRVIDIREPAQYTVTKVDGSDSHFVIYIEMVVTNKTAQMVGKEVRKLKPKKPEVEASLLGEHLQSVEDNLIEKLNILVDEINELDCKAKENRKNNILQMAQNSGILAAKELNLPICHTIQASLETIVISKCKVLTINISAEQSPCGYQPKYENYTFAADGWRLTPYSSCGWTSQFVNINDALHRYENGSWIKIEPKMRLPHKSVMKTFNITLDSAIGWIPQKPTHIDYEAIQHQGILADIVSVLQNNKIHRVSKLTGYAFDGEWINKLAEWSPFQFISTWFWRIVYVLAAIAGIVITIKVCQWTRCCSSFRRGSSGSQATEVEIIPLESSGPVSGLKQDRRRRRSHRHHQLEELVIA